MVVAAEADLVRRAQAGDRTAFAALYDAYLPKIHDFALGMLRNRADAEDVTSEVFLKAVERLTSLKDADAFRGWLYTIARNSALNVIDARKRAVPTAEHDETATLSEGSMLLEPTDAVAQHELRDLIWDAAATLNPRDYQVFELTVRHGLGSAEIADVLEVRPAYAYILVNRLKGSVAEALEAIVLVRTARTDCPDLDALLVRYDEQLDARTRKAVTRHAKGCDACTEAKRTKASVPALLAGTAFAAPSAAFAAELAAKIDAAWDATGPGAHPRSRGRGRNAATVVATIAAVIVLTAGVVGATAQRTLHHAERTGAEATIEPTRSPSPDTSPSPSASPDGDDDDDTPVDGRRPAPGADDPDDARTPAPDDTRTPTVITPRPGTPRPSTPRPTAEPTRRPRRTPAPTPEPEPTPTPDPAGRSGTGA